MNSYELSRAFWNWAFENPEKVKPNHIAIYFFAVERCNRLGWKDKFGFPTDIAMESIGIRSYNTYISHFNDLVDFGFFDLIERSKNQHSSNIISLHAPSKNDKAPTKALDKAFIKHTPKQSESTHQSKCSIDKQVNKEQESAEETPRAFNPIEEIEKSNKQLQNKIELKEHYKFLKEEAPSIYDVLRRSTVFEKVSKLPTQEQINLVDRFNSKCLEEDLPYDAGKILGRFKGYAGSWITRTETNSKKGML